MVAELWGHGITDTHKVYDVDGLALYFKAYLSDVEYEESEEDAPKSGIVVKKVDGKNKKFIKIPYQMGRELHLVVHLVKIQEESLIMSLTQPAG